MTTDPHAEPAREFSASTDLAALLRDLPVVKDIKDFAIPGVFDSDEELNDFLAWHEVDRQSAAI